LLKKLHNSYLKKKNGVDIAEKENVDKRLDIKASNEEPLKAKDAAGPPKDVSNGKPFN
jgi:hypothetical protein